MYYIDNFMIWRFPACWPLSSKSRPYSHFNDGLYLRLISQNTEQSKSTRSIYSELPCEVPVPVSLRSVSSRSLN